MLIVARIDAGEAVRQGVAIGQANDVGLGHLDIGGEDFNRAPRFEAG